MTPELDELIFMDAVMSGTANAPGVVPFSRDENGYMRGVAIIGRVGIQTYKMRDGSVIRVLRRPEEVSDPESLASMRMLPMSKEHPQKNFTPATIRGQQVGSVGENVHFADGYVYAPLIITEQAAQDGVYSGAGRELSIGYKARVVREAGLWNNEPYDIEQTRIRGNHVALTAKARAGAEAAVEVADSASAEGCDGIYDAEFADALDASVVFTNNQQPKGAKMNKFCLPGGKVVEADQEFIDSYLALVASVKETQDALVAEKSSHAEAKAALAAKDIELHDAKSAVLSDDDIMKRVQEHTAVKEQAASIGVEFKDGVNMSVADMKKAAVKVAMPDAEFLDSEVDAFFRASVQLASRKKDVSAANRAKMSAASKEFKDSGAPEAGDTKETAQSIMDSYHDSLRSAYNNKTEE